MVTVLLSWLARLIDINNGTEDLAYRILCLLRTITAIVASVHVHVIFRGIVIAESILVIVAKHFVSNLLRTIAGIALVVILFPRYFEEALRFARLICFAKGILTSFAL
jgi:hypothetical protein